MTALSPRVALPPRAEPPDRAGRVDLEAQQADGVDLAALRAAVPRRCFEPDTARSLAHLAGDLAILAALYTLSCRTDTLLLLVPLWFLEGTMLWALFVIGHDCGHGAFSRHARLGTVMGHLLHTPLLVPYHAWRISHRVHHAHAGDVERDEGWFPLTEAQWRAQPWGVRVLRSWGLLLVFPLYLLRGTPARTGNHYDASSPMFPEGERAGVRASIRLCQLMALGLVVTAAFAGPWPVVKHWLVPWLVCCGWVSLVTYLHHTDADVPWYRGAEWSWLRGALSTVDRRFGPFEAIHHHAGCHVVHHLFPGIPHYRLREAAAAIRPLLGPRYREGRTGVLRAFVAGARGCRVVPAEGGVVRYAALPPGAPSPGSGDGASPIAT